MDLLCGIDQLIDVFLWLEVDSLETRLRQESVRSRVLRQGSLLAHHGYRRK
jgi:hypothetical protein